MSICSVQSTWFPEQLQWQIVFMWVILLLSDCRLPQDTCSKLYNTGIYGNRHVNMKLSQKNKQLTWQPLFALHLPQVLEPWLLSLSLVPSSSLLFCWSPWRRITGNAAFHTIFVLWMSFAIKSAVGLGFSHMFRSKLFKSLRSNKILQNSAKMRSANASACYNVAIFTEDLSVSLIINQISKFFKKG